MNRIEDLSNTVKSLNVTVAEQREVINSYEVTAEASVNGVTVEQERINNNIVIRGLEIEEDTDESVLVQTFENICTHIGISSEGDLKPVSVTTLASKSKTGGPVVVSLVSREAKQKFLRARRIKKDIRPTDIKRSQKFNKPLIITEQLTKDNQKLLFEARSLRGRDKFKFIWSFNGQILARRKKKSPVIRIKDTNDVERLRSTLSRQNRNDTVVRDRRRPYPTTTQNRV